MNGINPYEPQHVSGNQLSSDAHHKIVLGVIRATLLGALGYGLYFGGVFAFTFADSSVHTTDARWGAGTIVAFAFAVSEVFVIEAWSLNKSVPRRVMIAGALVIASLVITGQLCALIGIELRRNREPLLLPWVVIGGCVFLTLALLFCRGLPLLSKNGEV